MWRQSSTFYMQELPNIIKSPNIDYIMLRVLTNEVATEQQMPIDGGEVIKLKKGETLSPDSQAKLKAVLDQAIDFKVEAKPDTNIGDIYKAWKAQFCNSENMIKYKALKFNIVDPCTNQNNGGDHSYWGNGPATSQKRADEIYTQFCSADAKVNYDPDDAKKHMKVCTKQRVATSFTQEDNSSIFQKVLLLFALFVCFYKLHQIFFAEKHTYYSVPLMTKEIV